MLEICPKYFLFQVSELKLKLQNFESTENQKVIDIPQLQSIEESKR